jgi:hypothetical protein
VARATPVAQLVQGEGTPGAAAVETGPEIEVVPAVADAAAGTGVDMDTGIVRTQHRGFRVVVRLSRVNGIVRALDVAVGAPGAGPADTAIEPHEIWMARAPEERPPHARVKTGDPAFDRVLGVYGPLPVQDRTARRRLLRLDAGTVSLWRAGAASFVSRASTDRPLAAFATAPSTNSAARGVADIVDLLCDLVDSIEAPAPEPAPPGVVG